VAKSKATTQDTRQPRHLLRWDNEGVKGVLETIQWIVSAWEGRIYQQSFVDTYARVAICQLYTETTAITAADLLNDRGSARLFI